MDNPKQRLSEVRKRIDRACARSGRDPASIQVIAVSKTFPAADIAALAAEGQQAFGESYLQEALAKISVAEDIAGRPLQWHFIGPVQSNKARAIASHFSWVHSVGRLNIAQRLSVGRPADLPSLSVCLQVNISGETSKSGCTAGDAPALCRAITAMPHLRLRGLMCVPRPGSSHAAFHSLHLLFEEIRASGSVRRQDFDTLSMGMSDDFDLAIEEGATAVRLGSVLFGPRHRGIHELSK